MYTQTITQPKTMYKQYTSDASQARHNSTNNIIYNPKKISPYEDLIKKARDTLTSYHNTSVIDDEKPFFFKRDAIVKGIKRVPPRLYFLIKRLIEGDISAYFELLDYGNHIDLVPYKDRCDFLKSKEEECISYQSLRDKMQYIEKWMRTYAISCDNAGYDFKGLRDLYESVLSLVEVQNVDRDIAKAYVKKMENN